MNIIPIKPNPSGAWESPQSRNIDMPPDGWCEITADTTEFYNGFIMPTFTDGVVTSFVCNSEAWEKWKASLPTPKPPQPTETEKLRADVDYLAMETGVTL